MWECLEVDHQILKFHNTHISRAVNECYWKYIYDDDVTDGVKLYR